MTLFDEISDRDNVDERKVLIKIGSIHQSLYVLDSTLEIFEKGLQIEEALDYKSNFLCSTGTTSIYCYSDAGKRGDTAKEEESNPIYSIEELDSNEVYDEVSYELEDLESVEQLDECLQ